jgi:hypothetical protein
MANLSFGSQQDSGCKKFKIIASSMSSLRKDARIAGIPTQTAMRATPADESAALLYDFGRRVLDFAVEGAAVLCDPASTRKPIPIGIDKLRQVRSRQPVL